MGLLDKINRWRGFYGDSVTARQEFASFPLNFDSFEEFADPFAHSMSLEIFKAKSKKKAMHGMPYSAEITVPKLSVTYYKLSHL